MPRTFLLHADHGCSWHPASLCSLDVMRVVRTKNSDATRRENALSWLLLTTTHPRRPGLEPGPTPRCALDRSEVADVLRKINAGGYGSLLSHAFAGTTSGCRDDDRPLNATSHAGRLARLP